MMKMKMETVQGSAGPPGQMTTEALQQLFATMIANGVVAQEKWVTYNESTVCRVHPSYWENSTSSKYQSVMEGRERSGFFVGNTEVHREDAFRLNAELSAVRQAPEVLAAIENAERRQGWRHINHQVDGLTEETSSVKKKLLHPETLGLQASEYIARGRYCAEMAEKYLPEMDALEARRADGCVIFFGGWRHTSGRNGRAEYWVVRPDGSLREPDRDCYSRSHQRGDHFQWWLCVEPNELALSWGKGTAASDHHFEVHNVPKSGCTREQLVAVGSLEDELEESWDGRRGFSSGALSPPVGDGWGLNAPRTYRPGDSERAQRAKEEAGKIADPNGPFAKLAALRDQMTEE